MSIYFSLLLKKGCLYWDVIPDSIFMVQNVIYNLIVWIRIMAFQITLAWLKFIDDRI